MRCPVCQKDLPEDAKYCLSCGQEVNPLMAKAMPTTVLGPEATDAMLLGFGMMALMFGFLLILPAALISDHFLWELPVGVSAIGVLLLVVRHFMIKSRVKTIEKKIEEKEAKVRCRYCGSLNEQKAQKCIGCGAPMT